MSRKRTYKFQTQAKELLDLMVHSVYSNKEIFLRELISNASDALDKLRYESLKSETLKGQAKEPQIRLEADTEKRILRVSDNGIGMNDQELRQYLGTIAKSGSKEFVEMLKAAPESRERAELIGQFGVGFYASFMVADRVRVLTRRAGEEQAWQWESIGDGTYSLKEAERDEWGTTVELELKPADEEAGLADFTREWTLRSIVKKYSDFVPYPIVMQVERQEIERDEQGQPKEGAEPRTVISDETLNSMKALWLRQEREVEDEEYDEFYKHLTRDPEAPLTRIVSRAEGVSEHRMLLYIPSKAPFGLYNRDMDHGVDLYIRRVFIMHDCKELLPHWLRFVKGVVDSEDLPLNLSREILQKDRHIGIIKKNVIRKVLSTLKKMKDDDRETYDRLWAEFGAVLKEGLFQDTKHKDELLDLVLVDTTTSEGKKTTLAEVAGRKKDGQEAIYYLTGASRQAVENSPHLEGFKAKGYEVLLLSDPVDELWVQSVFEYDGKPLTSVGKGAAELGTEEEKKQAEEDRKKKEEEHKSLLEVLQKALESHVKEVRFSNRLTESPSCLVGETWDMTPQMLQMMKALGQEPPEQKRILELNPDHPIVTHLGKRYEADPEDPALAEAASLLHAQALLAEGSTLPDPPTFARTLANWMVKAMS